MSTTQNSFWTLPWPQFKAPGGGASKSTFVGWSVCLSVGKNLRIKDGNDITVDEAVIWNTWQKWDEKEDEDEREEEEKEKITMGSWPHIPGAFCGQSHTCLLLWQHLAKMQNYTKLHFCWNITN